MGLAQLLVEQGAAEEGELRQACRSRRRCGRRRRPSSPAWCRWPAGRPSRRSSRPKSAITRLRMPALSSALPQLARAQRLHAQRPVGGGQLEVAGAVRGEVDHQHVVARGPCARPAPRWRAPGSAAWPTGWVRAVAAMVDQLHHAAAGVEALGQQLGHHACFRAGTRLRRHRARTPGRRHRSRRAAAAPAPPPSFATAPAAPRRLPGSAAGAGCSPCAACARSACQGRSGNCQAVSAEERPPAQRQHAQPRARSTPKRADQPQHGRDRPGPEAEVQRPGRPAPTCSSSRGSASCDCAMPSSCDTRLAGSSARPATARTRRPGPPARCMRAGVGAAEQAPTRPAAATAPVLHQGASQPRRSNCAGPAISRRASADLDAGRISTSSAASVPASAARCDARPQQEAGAQALAQPACAGKRRSDALSGDG